MCILYTRDYNFKLFLELLRFLNKFFQKKVRDYPPTKMLSGLYDNSVPNTLRQVDFEKRCLSNKPR